MKKMLNISQDLSLPVDIVTTAMAIIAIRGAGKSYTGAVLAEEMIGAGIQTVITDPTGVWWGLRSSADGKKAGIPVIVMGGNHGDVPLESTAGEVVADFVVESGASVILDLSLMRKGEQKRFMTAFAEHLYHLKAKTRYQTPLHMILDEADRFAPQKPQPEFQRLLGAIEDIVRLGRSRGLGITAISQRSAVLNKDVLTQIETLIVMRTTSPQDRKAMNEWVKENATDEERDEVVKSLAGLPNGTAWVWSPSVLKILKKVKIRKRHTFNSSATPKVGERRREPKKMADVDLDSLRGKISDTIARAKQNDPRELKGKIVALGRKIVSLEMDLAKKKPAAAPATKVKIEKPEVIRVPVIKDQQIKHLERVAERLKTAASDAAVAATKVRHLIDMGPRLVAHAVDEEQKAKPRTVVRYTNPKLPPFYNTDDSPAVLPAIKSPTHEPEILVNGNGNLSPAVQRIVNAAVWLHEVGLGPADKNQLAFLSDQSPTSGGYKNNLGKLRASGYITYPQPGMVGVTDRGRRAMTSRESVPQTNEELQAQVLSRLKPAKRRIVEVLLESHPESMVKDELARRTGQSPTSGGFKNNLGNLRTLKIIEYPEVGAARASDKLFINL